MTDAHTPRLLSDADAAADLAAEWPDLPSVGTEPERLALTAALGYVERNTPQLVRDEIRSLSAERDELASRVRELEAEVDEQCRINGMGAERESALMGRVRELEGALCQISDMTYDSWTNGATAKQIADAALASKEQP